MTTIATAPAAHSEKQRSRGALPALLFTLALVALLAGGVFELTVRPQHPQGLPEDAEVRAAHSLAAGRIPVMTGGLRFHATLLGGAPPDRAVSARELALVRSARILLVRASRRMPRDPRIFAARGHLELALHRFDEAASLYRYAYERAPRYAEARLGLGVTYARMGRTTPDLWRARSLYLEGIAQFAVIQPQDPEYLDAVYNRATLLADVGRDFEARRFAAIYLARDSTSAWAERLRATVAKQ